MPFQTDGRYHMSWKRNFSRFYHKDRSKTESYVNLQTQNNILTQENGLRVGEKVSVFASGIQGSFTVEAALVLTVFLLSIYGFLYLFLIFHIQVTLQEAAEQAAQSAAKYAYAREWLSVDEQSGPEWAQKAGDVLEWGIGTEYLRQSVLGAATSEYLDHSCIRGGSGGILFIESGMAGDDGIVDVVMRYDVELPVGFPGMTTFHFVQRSRKHGWIGKRVRTDGGTKENTEEYVYVTETGTVYHLYEDCTHIRLSVQTVSYVQVDQCRNENGGKYTACEKCCGEGEAGASVYISRDGSRYHSTLGCSGLKRQVKAITKEEAEAEMRLCGRCMSRQ